MKNLTLSETDTFEEVNKVLNMLIDNLNQAEGKILVLTEILTRKSKKKGGKNV